MHQRIELMKIISDKLRGRYDFHKRLISWSYLSLGNDVLTQTNKNTIKVPLRKKTKGEDPRKDQPPRKISANRKLINIIWAYSARKKRAKVIDEYSTLYPETNSDSPSVRSNGALLVSAKHEIKNINAAGKSGKMNHVVCSWALIMLSKFIEPEHRITEIIIKPIETS